MARAERWHLTSGGSRHQVEITDAGLLRRLVWTVDGVEAARTSTGSERVVLDGGGHGAVLVRLPTFLGPARRLTWWAATDGGRGAGALARVGLGGEDLVPEPGSAAALRDARILAHPRRYAVRRTVTAVLAVLLPVLLLWLLAQVPRPDVDLPSIPWPSIPWPDIPWPRVPWPDVPWPDVDLPPAPGWLEPVLDAARYLWPVLLAVVLARGEVRRRRDQATRRAAGGAGGAVGVDGSRPEEELPPTGPPSP